MTSVLYGFVPFFAFRIVAIRPVVMSNTYFMDRCLGWKGLCVEANPTYFEKLHIMRSCQLIPTCVGMRSSEEVDFLADDVYGGVTASNRNKERINSTTAHIMRMRCTTLRQELERFDIKEVDYLSLDVEGHELTVLKGIDWTKTKIQIITVEVTAETHPTVHNYLSGLGYEIHEPQDQSSSFAALGEAPKRNVGDAIYVHRRVSFGRPT